MRVALYVSNRVFRKWPQDYVQELVSKLVKRGDRVFMVSDDSTPEENKKIIEESDWFVGPPGEWYEYAVDKGVRRIGLLGPTLKGEGVVSPILCRGCLDKLENAADCFFGDEICLMECTPNDVLGAMCA